MTLCIAASCQWTENPALVFCSDTRTQSSSREWGLAISSDNADKSRYVGEFAAYVAGDPTSADQLITIWEPAIKKFSEESVDSDDLDLHVNALLEALRKGSRERKKQIQDHYFGINSPFKSLNDFLERGSKLLPKDQYRQLWSEMQSLNLSCEVILGGFNCDEPLIFKIGLDGEPKWMDQYAVIGTGSADALTFLAQNEFDEHEIALPDCLMRVMEALSFTSNANQTVSHTSRFEVRIPGEEPQDITDKFFKQMKRKLRLANPANLGKVEDFLIAVEDEEDEVVPLTHGPEPAG